MFFELRQATYICMYLNDLELDCSPAIGDLLASFWTVRCLRVESLEQAEFCRVHGLKS